MKKSCVKSVSSVFVLLAVVVGMLVGAAQASDVTWDASGDSSWTEPADTTSWSGGTYNSDDTAQFLGSGAGTVTIQAGGVMPGAVIVNSSANYTFTGGSIGGTGILTKAGTGKLTLSASNSYSGGMVISNGNVTIGADNNLGNTSGGVTFTGTATLESSIGNLSLSSTRTITLTNGAIATFYYYINNNPKSFTINGKITGNGGITLVDGYILGGGSGSSMNLNNTANDFTGSLNMGGTLGNNVTTYNVASLADGAGYGNIIFGKGNGAGTFNYTGSSDLTLNSGGRRIELASTTAGNTLKSSGAGVITVNTDLLVSGTGAKTLTLGGNIRTNTFAGKIVNGASAVSLAKADSGKWILSGTNTFTGATTISAGTLEIGGSGSLGSGTYAATISNASILRFNSTANQTLSGVISGAGTLIQEGAGTLSLTTNNTYTGNTTVNAGTLSLGNGASSSSLNDYSTLSVASGATLDLNYAAADKVLYLNLGGSPAAAGEWGASGSGAENESVLITGTGRINNLDGDVTSLNIGYWDGGTTDLGTDGNLASGGGSGTWNTTLMNWDYGFTAHKVWANSPVESAVFAGTAGTVTLGDPISISNLTINSDYYTILSNTLNFAVGGRITVNSALGGNWGTAATIRSAITGAPLVVLNLGADNTEVDFLPTIGSMQFGAKSGNGLIALGGSTTGNTLASSSTGKIRVSGGEWTLLGNASGYQHYVDGGTFIVNGQLTSNNRQLKISTNATLVAIGTIGNGGGNGVNFDGNTEGASTGAGGILKGTGRVWQSNLLNVRAEATIAPGYPTGTLTVTNCAVTINGKLDITVDGAQNSRLAVANNTLTISNATLNVNVINPPSGVMTIATYGTLIGQFAVTNGIDTWQVDYNYEGGNAIALIPPPSGTLLILR